MTVKDDARKLLPYFKNYVAWRQFGSSATCTHSQGDKRCEKPGVSIIAFVRRDGGVDIATFCEDHGDRTVAVLRDATRMEEFS